MNKDNIQTAIDIMVRVRDNGHTLDMTKWQKGEYAYTEEEATCDTVCCFAGWVAISPEWLSREGSRTTYSGAPCNMHYYGECAISKWLGTDKVQTSLLCGTYCQIGIYSDNPTFDDVIDNLKTLARGELL